jgi:GNAT superfamily N-acetyltransferase
MDAEERRNALGSGAHDALAGRVAFRRLEQKDREPLLAIAARIWEGHDYLPFVFDPWVRDEAGYFAGLFLDGRLVGCGRYLPLDDRRVWLESLRIDPDEQRHGLGRVMSGHIVRTARERGYREFLFSTYFQNQGSIRISEAAGFRRIATYTNLEIEDLDHAPGELARVSARGVTSTPGVPDVDDFLVTDWFFVPPGARDRGQHFPDALTLADDRSRVLIAVNPKYPETLEICWRETPDGRLPPTLIAAAAEHARHQGCKGMHTMLPAGHAIEPYQEAGFAFFEQQQDVYVYAARAEELRI